MSSPKHQALEAALGHKFKSPELLSRALTHSGFSQDHYERLEFLGDRVVNLILADALLKLHPHESEGALARRYAALVRAETLAKIALNLNLGRFIQANAQDRDQNGLVSNPNILSDVFEAVIAALYLDAGFAQAQTCLLKLMNGYLNENLAPPRDPKTALQEWTQSRALGLPEYTILQKEGPDHAPSFTVSLFIKGYQPIEVAAPTKKIAEKKAAEQFLVTYVDR